MDSRSARGNIAFYSVHQQKWINIRQWSFEQCLGKISLRGQESYIDCEIIPQGNIIILVSLLSQGCYFTTPVIKTKARNATDQIHCVGDLQTDFLQPGSCTDGYVDAWGSPGSCCSRGVRWDTSAGLSMAPAGPGNAWVYVRVKGAGWISQMLRALWHDLQRGKKRQIWLSYKQPQIPLTSAGAVSPFCRAEFDFESLGVQCQPFIHA